MSTDESLEEVMTKKDDAAEEEVSSENEKLDPSKDSSEATASLEDETESAEEVEETEEVVEEKSPTESEYLLQLQRLQAEFNNFRNRQEKEKAMLKEFFLEKYSCDLLPVIDNFERAMSASSHENMTLETYVEGIQMVFDQLKNVLSTMDIKPMESLGKPFDPNHHDAVSKANSNEYESDHVMEVLQNGWVMKEKVIRPAMVVVSDGPVVETEPSGDKPDEVEE